APAAQRASLFRSAGRAMAGTHDALGKLPSRGEYRPIRSVRSPSSSVRARVEEALASTPLVMLHWDYACGNLFVRDDAVWVLDPMPNFYMMPEYFAVEGFTSDLRGSPYVDAAQFVFSFRAHPRFSRSEEHTSELQSRE